MIDKRVMKGIFSRTVSFFADLPLISDILSSISFHIYKLKIKRGDTKEPRILYIDKFHKFGRTNTSGLQKAYNKKGRVIPVNVGSYFVRRGYCLKYWNKLLLKIAIYMKPQIMHIGKAYAVSPDSIKKLRKEIDVFVIFFFGDFILKNELSGKRAWLVALGHVVDKMFIMQKDRDVLEEFETQGVYPGFWWSGTDSEIFFPRDVDKINEVSFFSQNMYTRKGHEERRDLIKKLSHNAIDVHLYGKNWDKWEYALKADNVYIHPFVNNEEFAKEISKSKITITYNGYSEHKAYMACSWRRVFNCMSCGSLHMIKYFPGLEEVFTDRVNAVFFYNMEECVELVKYYIEHEVERERIALEGRKEVLSKHTWEHRVDYLMDFVN